MTNSKNISTRDLALQLDLDQKDVIKLMGHLNLTAPLSNKEADQVIQFVGVANQHGLTIDQAIAEVSGAGAGPSAPKVDTSDSKAHSYAMQLASGQELARQQDAQHQMQVFAGELNRHRRDQEIAIQALASLTMPTDALPEPLQEMHAHATELDQVVQQLRNVGVSTNSVSVDSTGHVRVSPGKSSDIFQIAQQFAAPRLGGALQAQLPAPKPQTTQNPKNQ